MARLIVLALLSGFIASCDNSKPTINIGVLRDSQSRNGKPTVHAVTLAVEQVNGAGGLLVNGQKHRVQLIILDAGNTPQKAIRAAQQLISDNVVGIIGPNISRTTIPVAGLVETVKLPLITPIATHVDITKNHHYAFRTAFSDDLQGQAMGSFAVNKLKAKTASVMFDVSNEYSQGLFANFSAAFEQAGGEVVSIEKWVTGQSDFSALIESIKTNQPDVIYLPGESGLITPHLTQMRREGVTGIFLGGDNWNQGKIINEPTFEGSYFTDHWHTTVNLKNSASQRFFDDYRNRYSIDPKIVSMLSYDSINLLFEAINRSSLNGESIQKQLTQIEKFKGTTGEISFSEYGDTKKPVYILRVGENEIALAEEVNPK